MNKMTAGSQQPQDLPLNFLENFQKLMFPPATSDADKLRWFTQGIHTIQMKNALGEGPSMPSYYTWGLVQTHGGPCGVLAVCASEMIRILGVYDDHTKKVSRGKAESALCETLGIILARACMAPPLSSIAKHDKCVCLVLPKSNSALSMVDFYGNAGDKKLHVIKILPISAQLGSNSQIVDEENLAKSTAEYLSKNSLIRHFQDDTGVILFLLSLAMTRGIDVIRSDMDDPQNSHLTAQFAHSSQELINILLTGQATSNTFDGSVGLGDGISCNGPQKQSSIGYLSQLEVLRYCSVGSYFKSPTHPIWIVGSTSHFTILFGPTRCLEESQSDVLLEKCRRVFKSVENAEENGYIPVDSLDKVMQDLSLDLGAGLSTLKAAIEVSGAGIILWSDFWRTVSCLMTGASLENVLDQNMKHNSGTAGIHKTHAYSAVDEQMPGATATESDEAMARRLAEEWGTNQQYTAKSDEELARELQAQFQAQSGADNAISDEDDVEIANLSQGNATTSVGDTIQNESLDVADDNTGASFPMFHYNALRNGELTVFKVTRQSSLEAVGQSNVPLSSMDLTSSGDNDLASVIQTKYNSCKCDWEGAIPPSLH